MSDITFNRSLSLQLAVGLCTILVGFLSRISALSAKLLRVEGLKYFVASAVPGKRVALLKIRCRSLSLEKLPCHVKAKDETRLCSPCVSVLGLFGLSVHGARADALLTHVPASGMHGVAP
jgi:hypothetical protein